MSDCIIWNGRTDSEGQPRRGKRPARRVQWIIENGDIGDGQIVRACPESTLCVNVDHLRLEDRQGGTAGPPRVWKDPVALRCQIERATLALLEAAGGRRAKVVDQAIREHLTAESQGLASTLQA